MSTRRLLKRSQPDRSLKFQSIGDLIGASTREGAVRHEWAGAMQEHLRSQERILIVEDDEAFRDDLAMALENEGYEVLSCAGGREAVELAQQKELDLVVSDIRMAGMSGLDTIEHVQQQQPMVSTLLITGFSAEADSIRAVRLGVGDFLKKPFRLDEFLLAVARQLDTHRARKQRWLREQNLQKLTHWSLESWLQSAAPQQANQTIAQAQLAETIAAEMGQSPEVGGQARRLILVNACVAEIRGNAPPSDLLGQLEEIRVPGFASNSVNNSKEESSSDEVSMIGRLCLAAQGRLNLEQDATLKGAVERAQAALDGSRAQRDLDLNRETTRQRRVLLQLARTQEQSKDFEASRNTYRQILSSEGSRSKEHVEASMGLMRLSVCEPEVCRNFAQEGVNLARQLNPLLHASCSFEAGLYMRRANYEREASALMDNARRLAADLGHLSMAALATVALSAYGSLNDPVGLEKSLELLMMGAHRFEVADNAWWLIPCLVQLQQNNPQPVLKRMLVRLGLDTPSRVLESFHDQNLQVPGKVCLVEALSGSSNPLVADFLQGLVNSPVSELRQAAGAVLKDKTGETPPPLLRIYTLGGFELFRGDERISDDVFKSWKQRFLLARLAGSSRPISTERLVDEFWPEGGEAGKGSLNVSFSRIRKVLRPSPWPVELDYVLRDKGRLSLNWSLPIWHDLAEFERLAQNPDGAGEEQIELWQRAVQLYRGPYLENCYQDWAIAQREQCERLLLEVLQRLIGRLRDLQRWKEVVYYAGRMLELDPCSQDGHLTLMTAYLQLKRPEAAVKHFEQCKKTLKAELNLEPSIAILECHQRALLSL